ncbi:MAG TPA: hypothetical protein VF331_08555 [Polyangiales bacterium]
MKASTFRGLALIAIRSVWTTISSTKKFSEQLVGQVIEHKAIEDVHTEALPLALALADPGEGSAVVVRMRVFACEDLARRFLGEARPAVPALDETRQQERARRRTTGGCLGVAAFADRLSEIKNVTLYESFDFERYPLAPSPRLLARRVPRAPVVGASASFLLDHPEHVILGPSTATVLDASPVQLGRDSLRSPPINPQAEEHSALREKAVKIEPWIPTPP